MKKTIKRLQPKTALEKHLILSNICDILANKNIKIKLKGELFNVL